MLLALRLGTLLGLIDTLATGLRAPLLLGGLQDVALRVAITVPAWCAICLMGMGALRAGRKLLGRSPAPTLSSRRRGSEQRPPASQRTGSHATGSLGMPLVGGLVIAATSSAVAGVLTALLARRGGVGFVPWSLVILTLLLLQMPITGSTESSHGQRNVILISLDTLRADHLGTYGYTRNTSPNLDRLAENGLVFEQAMSASHWTLPSHAAMLTGKDPVALGVLDSADTLSSRFETLAEEFDAAGWHTAAFVGNSPNSYIGARRGFDQGFDLCEHLPVPHRGLDAPAAGAQQLWYKQVEHAIGAATHQVDLVGRWPRVDRMHPSSSSSTCSMCTPMLTTFPTRHLASTRDASSRTPAWTSGCHPRPVRLRLLMAYATGDLEARPLRTRSSA